VTTLERIFLIYNAPEIMEFSPVSNLLETNWEILSVWEFSSFFCSLTLKNTVPTGFSEFKTKWRRL